MVELFFNDDVVDVTITMVGLSSISGIVVRAAALLEERPGPDAATVAEALDRNLCRCGAPRRSIDAVVHAGQRVAPEEAR